jgi:MOSC domain-containing protein YiiM
VLEEGEVTAGDSIKITTRDANRVTVQEITRLYLEGKNDVEALNRALQVNALPDSWKAHFEDQLEKLRKVG